MEIDNMKMKRGNKKGQVAIFVIIGLIIIVSVILVFMLVRRTFYAPVSVSPDVEISKCIENSLIKAEAKLVAGSFYSNITDNYEVYYGEKAKYLCKASQFYSPCVNQEPALIEHIRNEIYNLTKSDVEGCFNSMIGGFEKLGYNVASETEEIPVNVSFGGDDIKIEITKKIAITRNEETRTFEKFSGKINSPLFKFVKTATMIINYESQFCEFSPSRWMSNYPDILINVFRTGDGTKIYTLTDIISERKVIFAVKSCALPAGI